MKIYITIIFLFATLYLHGQVLTFEDQDFLNALIEEGFDTNNDNQIQVSEAEDVIDIDITGENFRSIRGIEGFTNLEYLAISSNDLIDTVDILGIPSLKNLSVGSNPILQKVLVSGHQSLEDIYLSGFGSNANPDVIEELNISDLPKLEKLSVQFFKVLNALEINNNPNLNYIYIWGNNMLEYLNVASLKGLETINLNGFFTEVVTDTLPLLDEYRMGFPYPEPKDLGLYPNLKKLYIQTDYNDIDSISVYDHPVLEEIYIENFFNLKSVKCTNLKSVRSIWITMSHELKTIELDSLENLETLALQNLSEVNSLSVTNAQNLKELTMYMEKLRDLTLYNIPLLEELKITSQRLKELDISTLSSLQEFELNSSTIEYLYIKNNSNENLNCTDCSSLIYLCHDEIDTFLNAPSSTYFGTFCPHTQSGNAYELNGKINYDYGNNGCDSNYISMPFVNLAICESDSTVGFMSSNKNGQFGFFYNQDSIIVKPAENSFNSMFNFLPDSIYLLPNDSMKVVNQDICIQAKDVFIDLELLLIDPSETRPGEEATYKLLIRNNSSIVPSGEISLDFDGNLLQHLESNPIPIAIDSNRITWDLPQLLLFDEVVFDITYLLNTPMDIFPLNGGDTLKYDIKAQIDPFLLDTIISNIFCDVVVNSFDPNDKQCLQGGQIELGDLNDYLYYKIRFENLGTADARNILVQDTLDPNSYITSSFQLVESSHEVRASIDREVLSFVFEGIDLGFNDEENDGFVIFKIKPKEDLSIGHEIKNSASIFFDYNFPIHTNIALTEVVENIILTNSNINFQEFDIYPTISSDFIYLNDHTIKGEVQVFDMKGNMVLSTKISERHSIDINSLRTGMYIIQLFEDKNAYISRFIKG